MKSSALFSIDFSTIIKTKPNKKEKYNEHTFGTVKKSVNFTIFIVQVPLFHTTRSENVIHKINLN